MRKKGCFLWEHRGEGCRKERNTAWDDDDATDDALSGSKFSFEGICVSLKLFHDCLSHDVLVVIFSYSTSVPSILFLLYFFFSLHFDFFFFLKSEKFFPLLFPVNSSNIVVLFESVENSSHKLLFVPVLLTLFPGLLINDFLEGTLLTHEWIYAGLNLWLTDDC